MARTSAVAGRTTDFKRGDGASSEAFTVVAEIKNINWSGRSRETIDATNMDSDAAYREYISNYKAGGEVSIDGNWTVDGYDDMVIDLEDDDPHSYQILFGDATATLFDFEAFLTNIDVASSQDDAVQATMTFQITGQPTMTS